MLPIIAVSPQRLQCLRHIVQEINQCQRGGFLRVGVDGVDGAGKTTFAGELAGMLRGSGRSVIRASVDDFHNPKEARYRLGRASPEGFFLDSYNYPALKEALLDPFSPGGSGRYRLAAFDTDSDAPFAATESQARPESILVLDGIFLHRPVLRTCWDFSIFLEVAFEVSIPRGALRGSGYGLPDPLATENRRYIEGQKLYLRTCEPKRWATLTLNNNDLSAPYVVFPENAEER